MIRFLVMNAALVAATSLVTGCGGGRSGATGTVYNARLAYENLLSAPSKSFVLNGTASNGDLFTLTWTIAPQGQATFQLTNTLAQQVDSSVVIAKGAAVISSGTQQSYLTGTFIGLGSFRPADGSCSESSGQQYPTAATVGQSGSLGTSIIYGTCNKTLTDIIGSIEGTWSVETIGSITYVCSNSISKDNAGAVLSTEVNCVEFTPAGAVGTHARWTVTVQGETVVFSN